MKSKKIDKMIKDLDKIEKSKREVMAESRRIMIEYAFIVESKKMKMLSLLKKTESIFYFLRKNVDKELEDSISDYIDELDNMKELIDTRDSILDELELKREKICGIKTGELLTPQTILRILKKVSE